MTDIGGTGESTIHDAIASINKASYKSFKLNTAKTNNTNGVAENYSLEEITNGATITLEAGQNIRLSQNKGAVSINTVDAPTFAGKITANGGLDMANNKIINVAKGTEASDAVNFEQLSDAIKNVHVTTLTTVSNSTPFSYVGSNGKMLRREVTVDPLVGLQPCQAREVAFQLGLKDKQINEFVKLMTGAYKAFVENDFALFEVNPLAVRENGALACVDGKIGIDSNALYRLPKIAELRDKSQENERELKASEFDLNYVALEGNIGCMVNGAGLAMATMDIIKLKGGQPANFLDVGGGATKDRVVEAFKLILEDKSVKGVLINIFGGIVRCDMIAEAIVAAVKEINVNVPVVVRLEGNNAELGAKILNESGLKLTSADGLNDAAEKIVAAVNA